MRLIFPRGFMLTFKSLGAVFLPFLDSLCLPSHLIKWGLKTSFEPLISDLYML